MEPLFENNDDIFENKTMEDHIGTHSSSEKQHLDNKRLENHGSMFSEINMMKEKFAKLLLGEDISGSGNGVCSAPALSNAMSNLCATIFGQIWRLEPLPLEKKSMWRREREWILSVSDHIVELVPSLQTFPDGSKIEVMTSRQRSDLHIYLPALRKLDNMLLDILDSFDKTELWYADQGVSSPVADGSCFRSPIPNQVDKWVLPVPRVPDCGLSDDAWNYLQYRRDGAKQLFKAAMAINRNTLANMKIPKSYLKALPKNARPYLGDLIHHYISFDQFSPECLLECLDLSSDHQALDIANRVEASIYIRRRRNSSKPPNCTNRSIPMSSWEMVKDLVKGTDKREHLADRAESLLLRLKQHFPGLCKTANRVEASIYIRRRRNSSKPPNCTNRSIPMSSWEMVKDLVKGTDKREHLADRAESLLLRLKQHFPGLCKTANRVEASIYIRRRRNSSKPPNCTNRSIPMSSWEMVKDLVKGTDKREHLADRAESLLLRLKQHFPGLCKTANRVEASIYIRRRRNSSKPPNCTNRSIPMSSWEMVKDLVKGTDKREHLADRAESLLLRLKQHFPGLCKTANRVEASIYIRRRRNSSKPPNCTNRSIPMSSWEMVKDLVKGTDKREHLADRAESLLLHLKQHFPGLCKTTLDMNKIKYNKVNLLSKVFLVPKISVSNFLQKLGSSAIKVQYDYKMNASKVKGSGYEAQILESLLSEEILSSETTRSSNSSEQYMLFD